MVTTSPVIETNSPFCVTRSRNGGPWPGAGGSEAIRTTTAMSTGIAASARSMANVRRRPRTSASSEASSDQPLPRAGRESVSLRNVEALPGEGDEAVLERFLLHPEAAEADAGRDERRRDGLGQRCVLTQDRSEERRVGKEGRW